MKTIVPVAADGQLTLPRPVREQIGLARGGEVELDITDGTVVLRPVDRLTPEEEAAVRRADADFAAGRYRSDVTEEELLRLAGEE
jgi:AbrB family looped-hinge helix DNA binding protein